MSASNPRKVSSMELSKTRQRELAVKTWRSRMRARRTMLRKELAEFEAIERHLVRNHTPESDRRAAARLATFKHGIDKLTQILEAQCSA